MTLLRHLFNVTLGVAVLSIVACGGPSTELDGGPNTTPASRASRGNADESAPDPTDAPPPTLTLFPTATLDDPEWENRTPGIERREIVVTEPRTATPVRFHMVRVDPDLMDFKVHYEPGKANSISGWQSETGAWVVVNGGFFDGEYNADGVTFIEGEEFGLSPGYEDKISVGGIFAVEDGGVSILTLGRRAEPPGTYNFDYATQSYPMLLMSGAVPGFNRETGQAAQRTVVAMDEQGGVIFIVIRTGVFTLYGLSRALAELNDTYDLGMTVALNLDGGKSSGMEVWAGPEHTHWEAATALPIVIAVYPKEGVPVVPQADIPPVYE